MFLRKLMNILSRFTNLLSCFFSSFNRRYLYVPIAASLAGSDFANWYLRPHLLRWAGIHVGRNCVICPAIEVTRGELEIDHHVFINSGCRFECQGKIRIGPYCQIGPHVSFETVTHEISPAPNAHRQSILKPILVGSNVWIGANALILAGVTIGDGAVIAAGAVVTQNVRSCTLVGGVPARVIREIGESPDPDQA